MHRHKANLKQTNKPFKGKSNKKNVLRHNTSCLVSKHSKPTLKHDRDNKKTQIRRNKLKQLVKRKSNGVLETPILCTIVPFSSFCNPFLILESIANYIYNNYPNNIHPNELFIDLRSNKIFNFNLNEYKLSICIAKYGDILNSLDPIKCSDIIFASFGYNSGFQSFDEFGYKLLKSIKLQGQINVIGLFSSEHGIHLEGSLIDCEKVMKKSFEIEFPNSRFFSLSKENDIRSLISLISHFNNSKLNLRYGRGYLLSEYSEIKNVTSKDGVVETQLLIKGFVRGVGLSVNFPVHITGFGDFTIRKIYPIKTDDIKMGFTFHNIDTPNLNKIEDIKNKISTNELFKALTINSGPLGLENANSSKIISMDVDAVKIPFNEYIQTDEIKGSIAINNDSDDEFGVSRSKIEDERRIDQHTVCRTRFSKYRGMESLRTSNWDPYEGLPNEYSQISEIENFRKTGELSRKLYLDYCTKESFAGKYCEITLVPITSETNRLLTIENISNNFIILSSILPLEQKIGVMNFRVKRTNENKDIIKNKTPLILQTGFRRFFICPTFSSFPRLSSSTVIERGQILKLCAFLTHDEYFVISCYSTIIFPPCPVLLFSTSDFCDTKKYRNGVYKNFSIPRNIRINDWPLAWGDIIDADPYHVIVKRIILVGSIFKVRKTKGVVRFMFNNPEDVKWFMPIGLKTRNGVRGVIREPLGMHGYMKCLFSKPIQQNEIVGMSIYKRVFPKWFPFTWFKKSENYTDNCL
ncbi:Tsr1p GTpase [Cryptosporidium ryanae]|uniref:Tsr1p GTpase n=1 Tax=Cryptosporidium ryanae TaxID=515981 RepID=UPI00351A9506|nr:Tsr1p GTpase [Cryptosporidium ryanae]